MFKPKYGQTYERIFFSEVDGLQILNNICTRGEGEKPSHEVSMGNCFPVGTLTEHDLAKVEDCIRGLHAK